MKRPDFIFAGHDHIHWLDIESVEKYYRETFDDILEWLHPIYLNGKYFVYHKDAVSFFNATYPHIKTWVSKGIFIPTDTDGAYLKHLSKREIQPYLPEKSKRPPPKHRNFILNGLMFRYPKDAAIFFKCATTTIAKYASRGEILPAGDDGYFKTPDGLSINGLTFPSFIAASKLFKCPNAVIGYYLNRGEDIPLDSNGCYTPPDKGNLYDVYTIYLMTNAVNNKQYVGLTIKSLAERFQGHKGSANSKCQRPLSRAIRKHGIENFSIKEITTCTSAIDAVKLEQQHIREYGTLEGGYNASIGGEGTGASSGASITVNQIAFNNVGDAAQHFGCIPKTIYRYLNINEELPVGANQKFGGYNMVIVNGLEFASKVEAAEYFNCSASIVNKYVQTNEHIPLDDYGLYDPPEEVAAYCFNGIEFPTIVAAAKHFKCSAASIKYYAETGIAPVDETGKLKTQWIQKPVTIDGVEYYSQKEAARKLGISKAQVKNLAFREQNPKKLGKQGYDTQAVKCELNGKTFSSLGAAGRYFGCHTGVIKNHIIKGLDIHIDENHKHVPQTAKPVPCEVNGIKFSSLSKAAKHFNCSSENIKYYLKVGRNLPVDIDGNFKPSKKRGKT